MPGNSLLPSVPFNPNGHNCWFLSLRQTQCKGQTHFSWGTLGAIEGRSFLGLTEVGVIRMAAPQLLARIKGSELDNTTVMRQNAEHEIIHTFWISEYFCILFILYWYLLFYLYFMDKDPTHSVGSISHIPMSLASSGQCLFPASPSPGLVRREKKTPRSGRKMRFIFFPFLSWDCSHQSVPCGPCCHSFSHYSTGPRGLSFPHKYPSALYRSL